MVTRSSVNDVRIAVLEACEAAPNLMLASGLTALFAPTQMRSPLEPEPWSKRQDPDAFFTIERQTGEEGKREKFSFLLEVDMATESNSRLEK